MIANIIQRWNAMSTYRKIRRVISIGLIGFAIWALTPYLYNRRVDEAFPSAVPAPTAVENVADMVADTEPTAPVAAMIATTQPTAIATASAMATTQPTSTAEASTQPVRLAQGSLVPGSTPGDTASGAATLYRLSDGTHLLRLQEFSTTNGPDLFVALSGNANPDADGIGAKESYLQLAALKGNQGNQNYELPAGIDLSKYKSVVIWCRAFNIVFGYATLQPAS